MAAASTRAPPVSDFASVWSSSLLSMLGNATIVRSSSMTSISAVAAALLPSPLGRVVARFAALLQPQTSTMIWFEARTAIRILVALMMALVVLVGLIAVVVVAVGGKSKCLISTRIAAN